MSFVLGIDRKVTGEEIMHSQEFEIVSGTILVSDPCYECPHCGGDCDSGGYCGACDAYEDDKSCGKCGDLLDYDGVCPSCIMEEEEGQDKLIFEDEDGEQMYNDVTPV